METTINQTISASYADTTSKVSLFKRFMNYCKGQENNRLLWLGIALAAHGCVLTPITLMAVLMAGTNMALFMLALIAMGLSVVTNLAAMPTRVTIPVFVFSILIDIAVIIAAIAIGFDITTTYI
jgi:hypothetical protein